MNVPTSLLSVSAAASKYRGVQMKTSSPVQILAMLFDGAIRFCNEADDAFAKKDLARAGERIGRAMRIIDEFIATLNPEHDPAWADEQLALYGFCKKCLYQANLKRDRKALADAVDVLTPLRDAWKEVASRG